METEVKSAFKTGSSVVVEKCQVCRHTPLDAILFLGYLPPVNEMHPIGEKPREQPGYPAQLLYCPRCHLVQLGLIVDAELLFPATYPYTSSTTRILRENFAQFFEEQKHIAGLKPEDLVVDIGSNDGNLLSNFIGHHRILGITPEDMGKIAISRGIPTIQEYFTREVAERVKKEHGPAGLVTATNVFAHMENINDIIEAVLVMLAEKGMFVTESHYLFSLLETVQYDTIYHEHLRYYSLHSLMYLLELHGLEIIHACRIPTHGGSIRVYSARRGAFPVRETVGELLKLEAPMVLKKENLLRFKDRVVGTKLALMALLDRIKKEGKRIYGISAPSRASTLINYLGLDDGIIDSVLEIKGSHKIGRYVPGTLIPVEDEARLFEDPPDYALLFSWHIAEELIPRLREKGFRGKFIIPLPEPAVVD